MFVRIFIARARIIESGQIQFLAQQRCIEESRAVQATWTKKNQYKSKNPSISESIGSPLRMIGWMSVK